MTPRNQLPHGSGSVTTRKRILSRARQQAVALLCLASLAWAQDAQNIAPIRPQAAIIFRPYLAVTVPPVRLANSPRLQELVRAGALYLTAQDAIALALENNIDIEVGRYNPFISAVATRARSSGRCIAGSPERRIASRIGGQWSRRHWKPKRRWSDRAGREFQYWPQHERDYFADRTCHPEPGSDCAGKHHVQPHQRSTARPGAEPGAQSDLEHACLLRELSARPS